MLSDADQALVTRDAGLTGLGSLLADEPLAAWLGVPVERRYLRYKAGTSAVVGALVAGLPALVLTWSEEGQPKLDKLLALAPEGSVLAVDRTRRLLALRPAADRDLPALRHVGPTGGGRLLTGLLPGLGPHGAVETLAYKPQRRWVGLWTADDGPALVLRAYVPADLAAASAGAVALGGGAPRTPRLLATDAALGLAVVEHLPGVGLDAALRQGTAGDAEVAATGAALAALHGRAVAGLRPTPDAAPALQAAARAVGDLLPDLASRADAVAAEAAARLAVVRGGVVVHGDFSLDQVVVGPDGGIGLIDLDAVATGPPAVDLAGAVGALRLGAVTGRGTPDVVRWAGALRAGYAAGGGAVPDDPDLAAHAAAALLRRAVEPFRTGLPDWAPAVAAVVALAEESLQSAGGPRR